MKIQIAGKIEDSLVNGEGMRMVIFTSGCKHNCEGCHNKPMQSFSYGDEWDVDELFNYIKNNCDLIDGITYSGGDPFEQSTSLIYLSKVFLSFSNFIKRFLASFRKDKKKVKIHRFEPRLTKKNAKIGLKQKKA